jgi:hypothetical protein
MFLQSAALKLTHLMFHVPETINHNSNKGTKAAAEKIFSSCTLFSILVADTNHSLFKFSELQSL